MSLLSELAFAGKTEEYERLYRLYHETENGKYPNRRFRDEYWEWLSNRSNDPPNMTMEEAVYFV